MHCYIRKTLKYTVSDIGHVRLMHIVSSKSYCEDQYSMYVRDCVFDCLSNGWMASGAGFLAQQPRNAQNSNSCIIICFIRTDLLPSTNFHVALFYGFSPSQRCASPDERDERIHVVRPCSVVLINVLQAPITLRLLNQSEPNQAMKQRTVVHVCSTLTCPAARCVVSSIRATRPSAPRALRPTSIGGNGANQLDVARTWDCLRRAILSAQVPTQPIAWAPKTK